MKSVDVSGWHPSEQKEGECKTKLDLRKTKQKYLGRTEHEMQQKRLNKTREASKHFAVEWTAGKISLVLNYCLTTLSTTRRCFLPNQLSCYLQLSDCRLRHSSRCRRVNTRHPTLVSVIKNSLYKKSFALIFFFSTLLKPRKSSGNFSLSVSTCNKNENTTEKYEERMRLEVET